MQQHKKHGVVRSTLTRRHQGNTRPRDTVAADQQNINPLQEKDLLKYAGELTEPRLPPSRDMIQDFASSVAQLYQGQLSNKVSDSNAQSAVKFCVFFFLEKSLSPFACFPYLFI